VFHLLFPQVGDDVRSGQIIGHIADIQQKQSMLHFEMYSGNESGSLTNKSNMPFQRRSDLMNPTNFLFNLR